MRDKGFASIGNIDRNLSLAFGSLVLLLFGLYFLAESVFFSRVVDNANQRLTRTITGIVAGAVNRVSFSGKYHSQLLVEQICKDNPDVSFVLLADQSGAIFVHSEAGKADRPLSPEHAEMARLVLAGNQTRFREVREQKKMVIEVAMPYLAGFENRVAGVIIVGVSTVQTELELVRIRSLLYRLILLLTILGLGAGYLLSRRFAKPVQRLAIQLRGLLERVPLLISIVDRRGDLVEASRSFDHASMAQQTRIRSRGTSGEGGGEIGQSEITIVEDGKERVFLTTTFPMQYSEVEAVDQICTIALDITRSKEAERELQISESRFRTLVNNIPGAVYRCANDEFWTVEFLSPEIETLSGFPASDFVGNRVRSYASIIHAEDAERVSEEVRSGIESRRVFQVEYRIVHADGTIRWLSEKGQATFSEQGEVAFLDGVIIDITGAKKSEEALRQSQKMDAIGRLAGGVAHDLNNLLTPIIGYGDLLTRNPALNDDGRDWARQILQASTRARDIVKQLLAFGRKQLLQFRPIDLNQVVSGFYRLLRRTIREDIEIELCQAVSLPLIKADPGQIEQILMNLALNAQDAMAEGGRMKITTGLSETVTSGEAQVMVRLSVGDSGSGMNADVLGQLFTPFFTTKPKDRGTGLGLATVYGIVKQHGGLIRVESSPGQGSTFIIDLPASSTSVADEGQKGAEVLPVGGSGLIMVVEDEEVVRKLAVQILQRNGYTVLSASRGSDCLALMTQRRQPIDLLLTDVVMPEMSGKELFERCQLIQPGIRVIYMSGHTHDLIGEKGILNKDIPFIQKPFTLGDLLEKVRQVLGRS